MSLRPLVTLPDSRLFSRSEEVKDSDLSDIDSLICDMFDTMYEEQGVGLAAVQVGVLKRIFVMDVGEQGEGGHVVGDYVDSCGPMVAINPEILEASKNCVSMAEGCLSIPGQSEMVSRPESVVLRYLDKDFNEHTLYATGLLSRCIQHELDHLNGIVFLKHVSKLKRDLVMAKFRKASSR